MKHDRKKHRRQQQAPSPSRWTRLIPACQVCARPLRLKRILTSILSVRGTKYPVRQEDGTLEARRVRWICGRCLGKLRPPNEGRSRGRGSVVPIPRGSLLGLQRDDLRWYIGGLEDGEPRWDMSRKQVKTFEDIEAAGAVQEQLSRAGHRVYVMILR